MKLSNYSKIIIIIIIMLLFKILYKGVNEDFLKDKMQYSTVVYTKYYNTLEIENIKIKEYYTRYINICKPEKNIRPDEKINDENYIGLSAPYFTDE